MVSVSASAASSDSSSEVLPFLGRSKQSSLSDIVGSVAILCCGRWFRLLRKNRCQMLKLLGLFCFVMVYSGQGIASYSMNKREWAKAPINDIDRTCPQPPYPVLSAADREKAGKICLTTLTDRMKKDWYQTMVRWRNFDNLLEMTWSNKLNYVRKHGYYLYNESMNYDVSRPPSWSKIKAALRLLEEENCNWVFWLDADTVIMNSERRIEDFLPSNPEHMLLLTTQKGGSYNAGAWIIKNTPWSKQFLRHWT